MTTLKELRIKYPQYNNWSDQELADKLYNKYYSDMDKSDFYNKIQFSPSKGSSENTKSLQSGITGSPVAGSSENMQFSKSGLSDILKGIPSSAENMLLGAGDSVQNLFANLLNAVPQVPDFTGGKRYNVPLAKTSEGLPYEAGRIGGDIAGFVGGGAPLNEVRIASEALPGILGQTAKFLGGSKVLPSTARLGTGSAIYGGISEPDDRVQGALINGILGGLTGGASEILQPSRSISSKISPAELFKNMEAAKGTKTNIGRIVESPGAMTQYENILSKIPFSGVSDQLSNVASDIKNKGENILGKYLGETSRGDVNNKIIKSLKDASYKENYIDKSLYNISNKIAEEKGFTPSIDSFKDVSNKYKDIIEDQSFLKFEPDSQKILKKLSLYSKEPKPVSVEQANTLAHTLRKYSENYSKSPYLDDKSLSQIFEELGSSLNTDVKDYVSRSDYNNIKDPFTESDKFKNVLKKHEETIGDESFLKSDKNAKQIFDKLSLYLKQSEPVSLEEANTLAGKLNEYARNYKKSPDMESRHLSGIYSALGKSLKNDIKDSVKESGHYDLIKSFNKAEKNHAESFAPFLDKQIYKFTHGELDPDTLVQSFIKTGSSSDQSNKISKLMTKISPESQDLVKYSYLSRALDENGNVNPSKLKNLWGGNKLGINQKEVLFPDKNEREELDKFSRLVKMNPEALTQMYNPKTGARASSILPYVIPHILPSAAGAYLGGNQSGGEGALIGGLAGLGGASIFSRALSKYLTSPTVRNKIAENILNPKASDKSKYMTAIANALSNLVQE